MPSPSLEQKGSRKLEGARWQEVGGPWEAPPAPGGVPGIAPSPSVTVITITMSLIKRQGEARQRGRTPFMKVTSV